MPFEESPTPNSRLDSNLSLPVDAVLVACLCLVVLRREGRSPERESIGGRAPLNREGGL